MSAVLITGARAPIALDLARSFAAAGFEAHLADSIRPWAARLGRFAPDRLHRLAPPRFAFQAFADDLARLVDRLDPVLIVPTCEEVFYLAVAAARLGISGRLFAPPPDLLRRLHSKVAFAELCRSVGVAAPQTRRVETPAALDAWRERSHRLVFKPEFSRFAARTLVRPGPAALGALVPTPWAPWAVQDFVAGEEVCLWSACRAGEVVAFAAYRPLWRLGRAAAYYFETDPDPAMLALARTLARATGATGHLSYDVIRRPDGTLAPIECNPRGVSGLHLFDAEPRLARALIGQTPLQEPRTRARHVGPAMWLFGAPDALLRGRLGAFRRDLARSRDVLVRPDAPLALAGALIDAGRFTLAGLSRGRSAAGQTTDDIEWNGEAIG
jgi:hypothetical protein